MSGLTLGSLFSGSGGFELAGMQHGITPAFCAEIEPFPIRVTTKRIPQMKHCGDITKMHGGDVEPVDIITFGFPCTDVSCAGPRLGLNGKRTGLFFEAIRLIREMREATNDTYPRYLVAENVPGLYSSAGGRDYQTVLTELLRLKDPEAVVPLPEGGKWLPAGEILGDGHSLAWRTFDPSRGWGIPQRRRRIYLVVDLDGERAGQILFEPEGVSGYTPPGGGKGQAAAAGADGGVAAAGTRSVGFEPGVLKRKGGHAWEELCSTLRADMGDNQAAVAIEQPPVYAIQGKIIGRQPFNQHGLGINEDVSFTLDTADRHAVAYSMTVGSFGTAQRDVAATIMARDWKDPQVVAVEPEYIIRRLMPQECALLQGFPADWCVDLETPEPTEADIAFWTDVFETWRLATKPHVKPRSRNQIVKWLRNPYTEAAEYKLFGNGITLPIASFVLAGIAWAAMNEKCRANCAT